MALDPLLTLTPRGVTLLLPLVSTGGMLGPSPQLNLSPRKGATVFAEVCRPLAGAFCCCAGPETTG